MVTSAVHSQLKIMKPILVPSPFVARSWTTIAFIFEREKFGRARVMLFSQISSDPRT